VNWIRMTRNRVHCSRSPGNEHMGYTKFREFLDKLSDGQLLIKMLFCGVRKG
jgi:hypothetical protein